MSKNDFLEILRFRLSHLPASEIEKHLSFYIESLDDRIEDGMNEYDAVSSLGNIDDIVSSIEQSISIPVLVKEKIKQTHKKINNKWIWAFLVICGAPLWIPLLITIIMTIVSVYIIAWSIIITLYSLVATLGIVGICGVVIGAVNLFTTNIGSALMILGVNISALGFGIVIVSPVNIVSKKLIQLTKIFILKVKSLFVTRKEVI